MDTSTQIRVNPRVSVVKQFLFLLHALMAFILG